MATTPGASLSSIEAIYRGEFHRFLHVALAITGDIELAADAVQEGFAKAIRGRDTFRGEGPLAGWVWRTVINCARARVGARRELELDAAMTADRPSSGNGHDEADRLRPLIAVLPERQRLVLFLRYYADLDYQAIADALEISPGTVGATLNAAHRALRPLIEEVSL